MKNLTITLIFVVLFGFSCCCRHSAAWPELLSAEEMIVDYPDSAMTILEAMDTSSFSGEEERALYGLLYTMAMVKSDIEVTDDSLIQSARRYFEEKKDKRRAMIANCYSGMVYYEQERYSEAIVNYYKALQGAEELGDWFYAGLACRGLSDIYNESLNKEEELSYAKQEFEYFQKSGRQPYLNYAMLDFARAHYNSKNFDIASEIIEELIDSANLSDDPYLHFSVIRLKAINDVTQEKFSEALPILTEVNKSNYAEAADSLRFCWALMKLNRHKEAEMLGNRILDRALPWNNFVKYRIYKYQGQSDRALAELEKLDSLSELYIQKSLSNNINGGLVNYVESQNLITQSYLKETRMKFWLITTILLSCLIIIFIWIRKKINIWNKEREAKINFAKELQEALKDSKLQNEVLAVNLESERSACQSLDKLLNDKILEQEQLLRKIEHEKKLYRENVAQLEKSIRDKVAHIGDLESENFTNKSEIDILINKGYHQADHITALEKETV